MSESSPYYRTRPRPPESNFEEGYWGVVVDPDGVQRDLRTERQRVLEDIADELAFVNSLEPGRILDVGCGLGYLLSGIADTWQRHGVELSAFAAEHAAAYGEIHVGNLRSARYPDRHFDVVTLYHVIEHMLEPESELLEIKRVLKPGGRFVIATPDFDSACARRFGDKFRMLNDKTHVRLFSRDSMHRFLRDHGFVVDRVELPFFDTRHFTRENLERLFDTGQVCPPFYGNIMTFYAHLPARSSALDLAREVAVATRRVVEERAEALERLVSSLNEARSRGATVAVFGAEASRIALGLSNAGYPAKAFGASPENDTAEAGCSKADPGLEIWLDATTAAPEPSRDTQRVVFTTSGVQIPHADLRIEVPSCDPRTTALVQQLVFESIGLAATARAT